MFTKVFIREPAVDKPRHAFPKIIFNYFRVIGITFGGLTSDKNNEFSSNKWLLYYGHVWTVAYLLGLSIGFFAKDISDFKMLRDKGLHLTFHLILLIHEMDVIQILVNQFYAHNHGKDVMQVICKYGIGKKSRLFIVTIWIIALMYRVAAIVFSLSSNKSSVPFVVVNRLVIKPAAESFLFINLLLASALSEALKALRTSITESMSYETLSQLRRSYNEVKRIIIKHDSHMTMALIITTSHQMLSLMLMVYIISHYRKIELSSLTVSLITGCYGFVIRLVSLCLINGMVHDEADQLLLDIDGIDVDHRHLSGNCLAFEELMLLKTMSRELPNGFTIGGLMSLRRTTLLSIFGFVFSYTILLIQTGKD